MILNLQLLLSFWLTSRAIRRGLRRHDCIRRDLQTNQLTGTLPDTLGSLTRLNSLCASLVWHCVCTLQHRRARWLHSCTVSTQLDQDITR